MLAFRASERSRTVDLTVGEPTLAPGAAEVLSVVGRAYAVVDDVDGFGGGEQRDGGAVAEEAQVAEISDY